MYIHIYIYVYIYIHICLKQKTVTRKQDPQATYKSMKLQIPACI